jgi:superfamily II DNA or RNA helicase
MTDVNEPSLAETRSLLADHAHRRFGSIPEALVADQVVTTTEGADWPVRAAALAALARRYGFARRDELRIVARPVGSVFGIYRTGAKGSRRGARPYSTELVSLEPLRMSCDCADFVRSSLGLCKHGLVVLEDALSKKTKNRGDPPSEVRRLRWSAVHPLAGHADRLARLSVDPARGSVPGFKAERPDSRLFGDAGRRLAWIAGVERALARGLVVAEPAARRVLDEERARAERVASMADLKRRGAKHFSKLERTLFPYQRKGVLRFLADGRMLLADDMGLGKTTQAVACCHALYLERRVVRGLLIVPASLKPQWKREWDATTRSVPLALVEGSPRERREMYRETRRGFLAIGYEQLLRDYEHVVAWKPDMVVLDEAQRIKNWATKSAAYVKALAPRYRLALTGTPMENRLDDLASIMDFVDDLALEPKWRLVPWHSVRTADAAGGTRGARNLETLRARLAPAMVRRVRAEVLSQLPPRSDTRISVELTPPQRDAHDGLRRPISSLISKAKKRPLAQPEFLQLMQLLTRQRIICNGIAQLEFEDVWPRCAAVARPTASILDGLFAPKLGAFRELLTEIAVHQRRKVVVFSQWRAMIRLAAFSVRDVLADAGLRAAYFTGAESAKMRERGIVDFHDEDDVRVMFLTDAGGVGLNLQRAASSCIHLELPWNPAVLEQRVGRIYRLGQRAPVDVYALVTEDSIESRIAGLVSNKKALFKAVFDGTSDEIEFENQASFLEGVAKLVEPVAVPPSEELEEELEVPLAEEPAAPVEPVVEPALAIERLDDGSFRVKAPPPLAAGLADLLEGLARSLRSSVEPVAPERSSPTVPAGPIDRGRRDAARRLSR